MMKLKKRTVANGVMILIIVAIALTGLVFVGHIKGWFDKAEAERALLCDFRGIITIEREGIAYRSTEDTPMREGDKITCDTGATVKISLNDGYITLGQGAVAEIISASVAEFAVNVKGGEAFVYAEAPVMIHFDGKQIEIKEAVVNLSVRKGAQSISVLDGTLEDAEKGKMLEWIGEERSVRAFSINSLNDFNISEMRKANAMKQLVFSNADLDKLEADRWAQMQLPENTLIPDNTVIPNDTVISDKTDTPDNTVIPDKTTIPDDTVITDETVIPDKTDGPVDPPETKPDKTGLTCTITIRCDTILDNFDELDPAKAPYVPASGCILPVVTVEFEKGETVFDVLNRVCKKYGIQIEYSWTPMYDSYYIEGINNLYEFDCGFESGWMYKVNGWFPNYGCSSYTLKGGESIVWCFTCKDLGEDVGADRW